MKNFEIDSEYRLRLRRATADLGVVPEALGPGLIEIYRLATYICTGEGLDVGASCFTAETNKGLPGAQPVDIKVPGTGSALALRQSDQTMDFVFSSHCYEHLDDPELAVAEAFRVLKPGGVLFLYFPFPGHPGWDPLICEGARPEHKWQPSPTSVSRLLLLGGFKVEYCESERDHLWSFVAIGRKPK